jgi:hypothetical protein
MRHLIRKPITWMVAAEIVIVAALIVASWYFMAGVRPSSDLQSLLLPSSTPQADPAASIPPDALAPPQPAAMPLLPGLNIDPAFWRKRLEALNGAQAQFVELEWRVVHSAMDSMRRYIETVVLPSIKRAESQSLPPRGEARRGCEIP